MNDQSVWWKPFATPQFVITLGLLGLATYCVIVVLQGNFSNDLKAGVITALVITGVSELRKFWLNSTSDSEKKNDTINTLVKQSDPPKASDPALKVDIVGTPDNPPPSEDERKKP